MRVLSFDVGVKSLSLCVLEFTPVDGGDPELNILQWETINVHQENDVAPKAKTTMKQDSECVINSLQTRIEQLWAHDLDHVIIENQPGSSVNKFSSTRMKILSHTIHTVFFMKANSGARPIPVEFVSPSSKLAGMQFNESKEDTALRQAGDRRTMGAKYRKNKQHAVDVTTQLLAHMGDSEETHQARLTFARATPKQDDLSDAFLLAYAFGVKKTTVKVPKKRKRKEN